MPNTSGILFYFFLFVINNTIMAVSLASPPGQSISSASKFTMPSGSAPARVTFKSLTQAQVITMYTDKAMVTQTVSFERWCLDLSSCFSWVLCGLQNCCLAPASIKTFRCEIHWEKATLYNAAENSLKFVNDSCECWSFWYLDKRLNEIKRTEL